ncbi:putative quinate permease [Cyphellophora attinorum]|uniref:Putative quinate permease n=1 Tax=Cyphellophora attinorum TaxID=1664694 RepID=A0A0N1HUQ9_9EURO|nr:putative quinate permease [Phialophora attinorum]KPI40774.1 putative quinate permease [Phialophora attinorum]
MAGLNVINYYAPSIFRSAGFTSVNSMLFLTGLFGLVKLVAAAAFMAIFVRIKGNRFWLNLGSAVCATSMFVLALCIWSTGTSSAEGRGNLSVQGVVSVLCVYIFSFFFGVSLGPISWNVCGEIFPSRLSAKCCTITTFTQWLFQIVIASVTPRLIASIGWGTYVVYGTCCTVSLGWCWAAVPETRGVALGREMDQLFEKQEEMVPSDTSEVYQVEEEAMVEVNETSPLMFSDQRRRRRSSVALIV